MDAEQTYQMLRAAHVGRVTRHADLAALSTYRLGGPADVLVEPAACVQLARLREMLSAHHVPHIFLGDGSNIIFDDAGLRGVAVRIGPEMARLSRQGTRVRAEAGISMAVLARQAARWGLAGVEQLAGVPGRLGGMVAMNGGCFGQTIGEVVRRVRVVDADGRLAWLPREVCGFDYRTSRFQQPDNDYVIAELELSLRPGEPTEICRAMLATLRERRGRFPRYRRLPNCGSVFKNSPEMYERFGPPGKVIEDTGCKGWRQGGAVVSGQHGNFITAGPDAKAADVLELIARIRRAVLERTGLALSCEVKYVTADGQIRNAHSA